MDYLDQVADFCPVETTAQIQALGSDASADGILTVFNPIIGQPACRGSVLSYLLSTLPARPKPDFMTSLLSQATLRAHELSAAHRIAISGLLNNLPLQEAWEREAFFAFIAHGVDRRSEVERRPSAALLGGTRFQDSPVWNRALYLAHLGDPDAQEGLGEMLGREASADIVNLMFRDLLVIRADIARPLLMSFAEDPRPTSTARAEFDGPTLADLAGVYIQMLP